MDKETLKAKLQSVRENIKPSYPSLTQMAKNLAGSVKANINSVLEGNNLKLSDNDASRRLDICKGCSFFDNEQQRCTKCGCKLAIKTHLKAEKCPIGKW
jgi:uncharacterized paraquat-inducible protein A